MEATMTDTKSKKKYRNLICAFDDFPNCCGILCPNGFGEEAPTKTEWSGNWRTGNYKTTQVRAKYATREEQAKAAVDEWEKYAKENEYACIMATLVWEYNDDYLEDMYGDYDESKPEGKRQYPELQAELESRGWEIREWLAPRHNNVLRCYTKMLG